MNDLEERLRAAFDARARGYEPDPHAWARIMERRPRRRPARWLLAALPVALLTVFVPALLNGGLGRNTAVDPTGIYQQLMKERTPLGKEASVDNPSEGKPLRIWFARGKLGYPEVCYIVERAAGEPYGACVEAFAWEDVDAWYVGSTLRDGAATSMDWGLAREDVGAVAGVTKGGQEFQGTVRSLDGAPYRLWTVTYPAQEPMSKIRISDVDGKDLGWWSRDGLFLPDGQPMSAPMELSQGISVQPYRTKEGTRLTWSRHGAELASLLPSAMDHAVSISGRRDMIIGLARKDVARIEVSFGGGSTASVVTRPDPWNLGVALFAAMSPSDDPAESRRVTAYDASGKPVWSNEEPARRAPDEAHKVSGEVMTLPGTEGSGRPVRIWFSQRSDEANEFCFTGGPAPSNRVTSSCLVDFPRNFRSFQEVTTYLPDPGADIYFGPALADWESVEAVLYDGRRVRASFLRDTGAPYPVWHVSVPRDTEVGGFVMKAKGKPDQQVPKYSKGCTRRAARSEAARQTLPAGITALLMPGCMAFWENGETASLPGPLPGARLSDVLDAARPVQWISGEKTWYGYAPAGTAKVELRMKGGATATAEAVPDTWGQNVTLFAAPVPKGAPKGGETVALTGYDAGGKELWRYELPKPRSAGS